VRITVQFLPPACDRTSANYLVIIGSCAVACDLLRGPKE